MNAAVLSAPARPRVHGFDRVVMRLSLALLLWAQSRAGYLVSTSEHARIRAVAQATERREHDWALRAYRVR